MLAVYTLFSKKRNVLVDPNKYEYNLQSMSRDKSELCGEKETFKMCSNSRCEVKLLLGKLRILLHGEIAVVEVVTGEMT